MCDKTSQLSLCNLQEQPRASAVWCLENSLFVSLIILTMCYNSLEMILEVFGGTSRYLYLAIMFAVAYILPRSLKDRQIRVLPESALMACWLAWTVLTAIWFHKQLGIEDYTLTSDVFRYPFFGILLFIMVNCLDIDRPERIVLFGFVVGGGVLMLFALASGQIGLLSNDLEGRLGQDITGNSNEFAYLLLIAVFAATYYAFSTKTPYVRTINIILIMALTVFIILSGSRKAFLGELAFFVMVFRPRYYRESLRKPASILGLVVLGVLVLVAGIYVIQNTYMGERFREFAEQDMQKDISFDQRFDGRGRYYREVVELVCKHPVLGVGLDRFRYYDQYSYAAHSDYVALIGETGVPGFILYFSAYLIVLARLRRAMKTSRNRESVFRCHLFWSSLITILLVALGRWNYHHIPTYVLLAMAGRYATKAANITARPLI